MGSVVIEIMQAIREDRGGLAQRIYEVTRFDSLRPMYINADGTECDTSQMSIDPGPLRPWKCKSCGGPNESGFKCDYCGGIQA